MVKEFVVNNGDIVMIIGGGASGKSAFLLALLGEM